MSVELCSFCPRCCSWWWRWEGPTWQSLLKDDLPLVNAGLCCPLGVEVKKENLEANGGKILFCDEHLFLQFRSLWIFSSFPFVTMMDCFDLEWKLLRWSWALLPAHSLVFGVYVAHLIPLVLLIQGLRICCVSIKPALCFVCWTPVCLLSSRCKQSCLDTAKAKSPPACYMPLFRSSVCIIVNTRLNNWVFQMCVCVCVCVCARETPEKILRWCCCSF